MFKIINKLDNSIFNIDLEPIKSNLFNIFGDNYINWLAIPVNLYNKDVIVVDNNVVEKPLDVDLLRQRGLAFYKEKAELFRKQKFTYTVNTIDKEGNPLELEVETDMTKDSLNDWVLVLSAGTNMAHVVDASTGLDAYIPVTDEEIQRARSYLAQKLIAITSLDVRITNKVKTADRNLITSFTRLNNEQLNMFTNIIMQNAENILQMTDGHFSTFVNDTINSILTV